MLSLAQTHTNQFPVFSPLQIIDVILASAIVFDSPKLYDGSNESLYILKNQE